MNKKLITLLLALSVISCGNFLIGDDAMSPAAPVPVKSSTPDHLLYLKEDTIDWKKFPAKPALGSPVDQADLLITLSAQANRTDAQKTEATHDQTYSIDLVNEILDPAFATKYPNVYAMLKQADNDDHFFNSHIKNANQRPRPYVEHPLLVTPLFTVKDWSYPSGHSSGSQLQARLLGVLFPDKANDLLNRARQIADSRIVAGAHYASDTEFGQTLGDMVFDALEANAKFKQDLAAAAAKDGIPLK